VKPGRGLQLAKGTEEGTGSRRDMRVGGFLGDCDGGGRVIGSDGSAIHSKGMVMRRPGNVVDDG
jgi:hypothetical protein